MCGSIGRPGLRLSLGWVARRPPPERGRPPPCRPPRSSSRSAAPPSTTSSGSTSRSRSSGWSCSPGRRARASRASRSTRSTPRASAATSSRCRPTRASSSARWRSRRSSTSAASRRRSRSSRRRPATTRARRSARSPRSTTTCACSTRASASQHCHQCGRPVERPRRREIGERLRALPEGTRFLLLAPLVENRKGEHREVLAEASPRASARFRIDGKVVRGRRAARARQEEEAHDRARHRPARRPGRADAGFATRLTDSVETALAKGKGAADRRLGGRRRARSTPSSSHCPSAASASPSCRRRASRSTRRSACAPTATASARSRDGPDAGRARPEQDASTTARSSRGRA